MITIEHYVGAHKDNDDWTPEMCQNAVELLDCVNQLLAIFSEQTGKQLKINPATLSHVSGIKYGGFRPKNCKQGAKSSSHKEAKGIDVYDPDNAIDNWISDEILESFKLYREHPSATNRWCHLSTRAPRSKKRTFYP